LEYLPSGSRSFSAKPLNLKDHGLMYEVLPHSFLPEQFIQPSLFEPVRQASLVFIPCPVVDPGSQVFGAQVPIGEETFVAAIELLKQSIGHGLFFNPNQGDVFEPIIDMPPLIAHAVHLYQVDKLGVPYIDHPKNVARNTELASMANPGMFSDSQIDVAIAAGWLHDVLEDSAEFFYREVTESDLHNWGINDETIEVVRLMTRVPGESEGYYEALESHHVGRIVKLADIAHNLNAARVIAIEPKKRRKLAQKYSFALNALYYSAERDPWFQPLVDSTERVDCPFASEEAADAFASATSGAELPLRLVGTIHESDMNQLMSLARSAYLKNSFLESDSDLVIVLALFWQFYLLEHEGDYPYNTALVAEFYQRNSKRLEQGPSFTTDNLFETSGLTIAEIILRSRRAASNLEIYNRPMLSGMSDEQAQRNYMWFDAVELSRDEAAELLFVAMCEYSDSENARVKVIDIKRILINCLDLIDPLEK
jgi:hypothetical protein